MGTRRLVVLALRALGAVLLLLRAALEDLEDLAPFLVKGGLERHLGDHGEGKKRKRKKRKRERERESEKIRKRAR